MKVVIQFAILIACLVSLITLSYLLRRVLSRAVRRDWLFYLLLAPGTIVHELCHALACVITLTPVHEIHLFRFRREEDGTVQLGEVVHGDTGPVRNFFIAVAPLLGASILIYLLSFWLLPRGIAWATLITSGETYVFLVLVFFVSLGLSPSRQDLKALPGFLLVVAVLLTGGYLLARWIARKHELSGVVKAVTSSLKTANMGLLFVLAAVVLVLIVVSTVWVISRK